MKPLVSTLAVASIAMAGAAFAMSHVSDDDGDGVFSLEELQVAFPDITDETFAAIDTDGDGSVSPEELQAAEDAGTLTQG